MMKIIPTRVHGILDYLIGAFLMAMPWIMGFANDQRETIIPVILGASIIVYSLFTDYEEGLFKRISMVTHLRLDIMGGILLAVSPWLFNFSQYVYAPHLFIGLVEVVTALSTETHPSQYHHLSHHH